MPKKHRSRLIRVLLYVTAPYLLIWAVGAAFSYVFETLEARRMAEERAAWPAFYEAARDQGPAWLSWVFRPGSVVTKLALGAALFVLFIAVLRLLSIVWYLVRYRGFTLRRRQDAGRGPPRGR